MKFDVNDIFVNLNNAAIDAVGKVTPKVKIQNTAIVDGNKFVGKDGEYQIVVTFMSKAKVEDAKKSLNAYLSTFARTDVAKKLADKDIANEKDTTFAIKYDLKTLNKLKETINIMKDKILVMEADAKPTFEISPNELLGKLHQAAMDQVEKKYGNVISLFNTAIDTNQDPPMASLADGIYKIKMKLTKPSGDKKRDKQTSKDALKLYLTWFAGKDVAKTADKPKWFIFKSKLDKAKEKNADGTQGYTVHYKMNVEKVDDKKNEKDADDSAAKESISYHFGGNKKVVVECNELFKLMNTINESKKINKTYVLKESEEVVEKSDKPKESSFIINPSELIGKLHEAAMQAMVKKYGKKCTIINTAIDEDHKPPVCTTKPGQYKIVVKQLKKGLFGSTKAAKEAIKLYLTVFAGEDVAKDILKARFFILKSKLEKGKHKGQAGNATGYSVYYQLDKGDQSGENESMKIGLVGSTQHVFECNEQYKKVISMNESENKLEEFVSSVKNKDNVKADSILEEIIQDKI